MIGAISRLLAGLSLTLKQPIGTFCDVETTHGDALVTKHSDYLSGHCHVVWGPSKFDREAEFA